MKVQVFYINSCRYNPHPRAVGSMHVHAIDCADCRRYGGSEEGFKVEAADVFELVNKVYGDFLAEGSMTFREGLADLEVFPCINWRDTKPADTKPADTKPAARKPRTTKPTARKPRTTKPADTKPADTKPAARKPRTTKPTARKPRTTKPAATKPAATKPAATKPTTLKAFAKELDARSQGSLYLEKIEKWYRRKMKRGGKRHQYYLKGSATEHYMRDDGEMCSRSRIGGIRLDFDTTSELTWEFLDKAVSGLFGSMDKMIQEAIKAMKEEEAEQAAHNAAYEKRRTAEEMARLEACRPVKPHVQAEREAKVVAAAQAPDAEKLAFHAADTQAVVANHYREDFLRLTSHPEIIEMAKAVCVYADPVWVVAGPGDYDFAARAWSEAHRRGVTGKSIGAIPKAIRYLITTALRPSAPLKLVASR